MIRMVLAVYTSEEFYGEYLAKKIGEAKQTLDEFPILRKIMGDLEGFKNAGPEEIRNMIIILCARATADMFGALEKSSRQLVAKIETALKTFGVESWGSRKLNNLTSRLRSNDPAQVIPAVYELLIGQHYVDKFGRRDVELEPEITGGKHPDLRVMTNEKPVF